MASAGKIAIVSHVLPPSSSGQAVMLFRLLRDWDPEDYCLISTRDYATCTEAADAVTRRLGCRYHHLPAEPQSGVLHSRAYSVARNVWRAARNARSLIRPALQSNPVASTLVAPPVSSPAPTVARPSLLRRWSAGLHRMLHTWDYRRNLPQRVALRARAIEAILRQERCTAIVAGTADLIDLPAAFEAAQAAGVRYYSYMFDDYATQWVDPFERQFAQASCPRVIQQATGVIVPNEFLARTYRERFGIESTIVRNPVEDVPPLTPRPSPSEPLRIVFTGTIYEAHFDAFVRLQEALKRFPPGDVELHIYTMSDPRYLADHGVGTPAIIRPSVSNAEALELQRSAHVLFLPLAFESPYPDIIKTSAPGKMGEYFASGRPVLVHSPRDSFLSWYCRQHDCAAVVDEPRVDELHAMLGKLMREPAYGDHLIQNAWQRARDDFHLAKVQQRFRSLFAGPN